MMVAIPLLSVTARDIEMAPLTAEKLTSSELTGFPFASETAASIVLMLMPSAERLDGFAVRFSAATGPAMKLTLVESLAPPQVAVTVAAPRLVGLIRVTVAFPLAVVALAAERAPAVVVKLTVVPSAMLLPSVSFIVAVIRVPEAPSATISELPALTVTVPTAAVPVNSTVTLWVTLLDVAVMVAVPAVVPAIRETVTTPDSSEVVTVYEVLPLGKAPRVVANVTEVP